MSRDLNADGRAPYITDRDTCHVSFTNMDASCLNENWLCTIYYKWLATYCTCRVRFTCEDVVQHIVVPRHLPI